MDILFVDKGRQDEIETFYEACQRHRDYYRGYAKAHHPLLYFKDQEYMWQCPLDLSPPYLSCPMYHARYKRPAALGDARRRRAPAALAPPARHSAAACKAFVR